MITLNLKGGMGNQMFQYAAAKSLSEKFNCPLIFNTDYFDNIPDGDTPRHFQLDLFNIPTYKQISKKASSKITSKIIRKIFSENIRFKIINLLLRFNIRITLDGYFQNEKYFTNIKELLLEEFKIKKEVSNLTKDLKKILENSESICLNIRRGDYLRPDYIKLYGLCTIEYYQKALKYIYKKTDNPIICIFSDDPEWVTKNFNIKNAIYAGTDILKDYEQMLLMSTCKHNIIANSSFSWWGAWLNQNPNKIVIAPQRWTAKNIQSDIIPKTWKKI